MRIAPTRAGTTGDQFLNREPSRLNLESLARELASGGWWLPARGRVKLLAIVHRLVTGRILHSSDLHLGRGATSEPITALRELIPELAPEILVVTGDLTHRGRRAELEHARELLDSLGLPLLAVPGNHDIPYAFPTRFTRTREEWDRVFGTTQPVHISGRLAIIGLNSVRPWRQQGGALESSQLDRLGPRLEHAQAGALRTAALHHHLAAPPWRAAHKRPVRQRHLVLQRLAPPE